MTANGYTGAAAVDIDQVTGLQPALDLKAPLASPTFTGTVAGITKSMVGLGSADDTSDAGKPISTATQTALNLKAPLASPTFTGTVAGITKSMVGLGNADNTSDAGKPISTLTQAALDLKAPLASPTFTGAVAGITKSMVGLGNVDNLATPGYGPADHGLIGWTFDPAVGVQNNGVALTPAGTLNVARIRLLSSVLTNVHFHLTVGGSVLTASQCYAAVFNDAGALIGANAITASLHSTGANGWGDGGFKTHPLVTPQAVTAGAWYKIVWWYNGTTGPTMSRASNSGSAIVNGNLSASTARFATANTGITTSGTLPGTLGAQSGGSTAWWVGAS